MSRYASCPSSNLAASEASNATKKHTNSKFISPAIPPLFHRSFCQRFADSASYPLAAGVVRRATNTAACARVTDALGVYFPSPVPLTIPAFASRVMAV